LRLVAALETGCRIGELLGVQFKQLRWDLNELHLSNQATKGLKTRYIPLSQELRAMLELRRHDPAGQEFGPDAYVFGNEIGERLKNYQKAWSTLRLRASGHGPHWGSNGKFLPCCRRRLGKMNLHIQRIDEQRRQSGEAAKWEQELADLAAIATRLPQAGKIGSTAEVRKRRNRQEVQSFGRLAQLVRARASHARGRRFESSSAHHLNHTSTIT
jgi:hypothetical protein